VAAPTAIANDAGGFDQRQLGRRSRQRPGRRSCDALCLSKRALRRRDASMITKLNIIAHDH
jgi:hypothetical protein